MCDTKQNFELDAVRERMSEMPAYEIVLLI